MTGALFHEPSPSPPSPSPASDEPAPGASRETPTSDEMELSEQSCVSYEESVFSEDIEDECAVEEGETTNTPTDELFKDDEGHMELEQDFWSLPGQFEKHGPSQASSSLTNPQAVPTSVSPVFETAPLSIEATAPVIEHASSSPISEPESPVTRLSSPILSPPGTFSPPPRPGGPNLSPPPPLAVARQGAKSRKHKVVNGIKIAKSQETPPPPPPPRRIASSPLKDARRSNRIAESKK